MEVWIHPSLRIKALGLTPSSRIQLPGHFQSSLSTTLGGCFIIFYPAWHILRLWQALLRPSPTSLGVHPSMAGMWLLWNALTLEFYTSRRNTLDGSRTHKILSLNQAPMPIRLQGQKKYGFSAYLYKKTAKLTHFCFPVSATSSFYATSHIKLLKYRLRDLNP